MAFVAVHIQPVLANANPIVFVIIIISAVGILTGFLNSMVIQMLFAQLAYAAALALNLNHFAIAYTVFFAASFAFITPAGSSLAPLYHGRVEWMGSEGNAIKYGLLMSGVGIVVSLLIGIPFGTLLY